MNPGERVGLKLAAGANVLLSAVLGGRAKSILEHPSVEAVLTAEATFDEVREYAAHLATRKRLPLDLVMLTMAALPVEIIGRVDILALALHFRIPVWSNDRDFEDSGVEWYTTATLLKKLAIIE